ncbi:Sim protein [Mycolicibacterium brisbanense]|uniref:Sim protein n=1 Tax=Mycolicibacterium brisbanense TaxID=146020 RepID=A0A117I6M3_9MYCO|nr:Sim protein [Mycolicibacterium brisbanense]
MAPTGLITVNNNTSRPMSTPNAMSTPSGAPTLRIGRGMGPVTGSHGHAGGIGAGEGGGNCIGEYATIEG